MAFGGAESCTGIQSLRVCIYVSGNESELKKSSVCSLWAVGGDVFRAGSWLPKVHKKDRAI